MMDFSESLRIGTTSNGWIHVQFVHTYWGLFLKSIFEPKYEEPDNILMMD